jgi:hypothetical protein
MSYDSNFTRIDRHGIREWWLNGKLHRADGPAILYPNGDEEWWLNGRRHREDGPAIYWEKSSNYWYLNGKQHRIDGPAVEYFSGAKGWWIDGKNFESKEEWFKALTSEQQYNYLWSLDND